MNRFKRYLRHILYLEDDIDRASAAAAIKKNIAFRGPNVIILACAIIIAAVGLNVNSIPVIIGAMLISPVMGPIIGFGLGLGTNDTELLKTSAKNFLVMMVISIVAASFYFLISPLRLNNPTELLARTRPTIYDVLIALFGGTAGMLEHARKERGTVLSGVAIATALMPPLCTVGYGIATLKLNYIFGAFYLFMINSFFIAMATFVVTKFLGFESAETDEVHSRRSRHIVTAVLLVMLVPSIISAIGTIRDNNFAINAERFVQSNKTIGSSYIFDHQIDLNGRHQTLDLYLAGEALDYTTKQILLRNAQSYGLHSDQIVFHEEAAVQNFNKNEVIRDLNSHYLNTIQELNKRITELEVELAKYKGAEKAAEKAASVGDTVTHQP
ncbi:MAG: TIGR00341 family protein [Bacteroidales bacterium]|nr:TIGR00341 family protein [Bacteroidales bacterium]